MVKCRKVVGYVLSGILLLLLVAGCGSKTKIGNVTADSPEEAPYVQNGENAGKVTLSFSENETSRATGAYDTDTTDTLHTGTSKVAMPEASEAGGILPTGYEGTDGSLDILAQRKVIRNANLTLEVDDFYASYGNLQAMLNGIGFIQESNIHRDYYTFEGERKPRITGDITIRINARYFDNMLNDIKGLGEVIDDRIYSTDVTDEFFDTEGRLKVLKIEFDYLEEYMRSLKDPDSIFKTRMRMTELQTEIERLTGTLNKWTDLVELSTIYIRLSEKYPEEMTSPKEYTYLDRLKDTVKDSLNGVVRAMGDLLIFIIQAIPTLVILGILFLIGYRIIKNFRRKKKTLPPAQKAEEKQE